MSLWTVPRPVKYLFETFPLKLYKSAPELPPHNNERKFALVKDTGADDMKSTFQLGVYNVTEYLNDSNILLPTDPICLSCQLIVNLRNGLSFPRKKLESGSRYTETGNFISVVSHHAAAENELPIFIEQESSMKVVVNSTTLINDLQMTRTTAEQLMKCLAVDSILYDFWIITVLFELDFATQCQIYLGSQDSPLLRRLVLKSTLNSVLTRFGFSNRNKSISKYFESDWGNLLDFEISKKISNETSLIIKKSEELLQLLDSALKDKQFLNQNKPHPGILDCKLAGIIYSVSRFGAQSQFGKLLQNYPRLTDHALAVLEKSLYH